MNIIKGLIVKDLLQLKSYKKSLIVFIIIYFFVAMSQSSTNGVSTMLIIMLTLGFGMFSIATFNYDESSKADKYILTLPLTRKEIVLSKYIFCICSTFFGCIIGTVLSVIVTFLFNHSLVYVWDILSISMGSLIGIGVVQSIQIPCIYKWGAEKGRLFMVILTALCASVLGGISFIIFDIDAIEVNNLKEIIPIILLISTILIYFISYRISLKIYDKKEI